MAKLYFQNSYGDRRVIGNCENSQEVFKQINDFLNAHNYKSHYCRSWVQDDMTWYDVGSWSEFFIWDKTLPN